MTSQAPIKDRYGRTRRKADIEWQKAVREKDQFICRRCGKYDLHIDTHHIASRARRPDLKHEVSNGVCLDRACHTWVHHHPLEATKLGLMSNASYEAERLSSRYNKMSQSNTTIQVRPCHACGKEFKPSSNNRPGKYCSHPCYWQAKAVDNSSVDIPKA